MLCLPRTNGVPPRGSLSQIRSLSVRMVGAFVLVVLASTARAQVPKSSFQNQTLTPVAPPPGATISSLDSLRFRWRMTGEPNAEEASHYRRLYQRLVVTPNSKHQGPSATERTRSRIVRTDPERISAPSPPSGSSKESPYPVVGAWFPEVNEPPQRPAEKDMWKIRLSHPVVGDWYPGHPSRRPLPDGMYRWEIRLVAETAAGKEQLLASSQSSTFTVDLAENNPEKESPLRNRTVHLDLFDFRLSGRNAQASLVRKPASDGDHTPWRIEIRSTNSPTTLHWAPTAVTDSFPDATVRLVDAETGGNKVDVNLKKTSTLTITDSQIKTLEVRPDQIVSTSSSDNVTLTLMPKLGTFLSGANSFGDISDEAGSTLKGDHAMLSWGGSAAFGSRNGTMNFRLTGLRTTGSLVSTTESVEASTSPIPEKLLLLTGDFVLRPIPRFLVQPYAIGGAGARRLSIGESEGVASELDTRPRWDPTVQVGIGVDLRLGNVTVGFEVVDYLTGLGTSEDEIQHDAFAFLTLGIPLH